MQTLVRLSTIALPVAGVNLDTDRLLPARFLRKPRDENNDYQQWLFHDLRFDEDGNPIADFTLNQPRYAGAQILVGDSNFGCGSSREGAVYALVDNGFRVVVAPSFGEIFAANCVRNGIAPLRISVTQAQSLRDCLGTTHNPEVAIDLEKRTITWCDSDDDTTTVDVILDDFSRQCLMLGIDEISLTLQQSDAIDAFEIKRRQQQPWL